MLTVIPWLFYRVRGYAPSSLILVAPVLLFSFDSFMLRLGWFNLPAYSEHTFAAAVSHENLRKSSQLVLFGNMMLWLGFSLPLGRKWGSQLCQKLSNHLHADQVQVSALRVMIVFSIGCVVRLYLISRGIGGYFSDPTLRESALPYIQVLNLLEELSTLALLTYASDLIGKGKQASWMLIGMLLIEVLTVSLLGFKAQVFHRFFYLAVLYVQMRRVFPWRLLLIGVATMMLVLPLNLIARQRFTQGEISVGDVWSVQRALMNGEVLEQPIESLITNSLEAIGRQSAQLEPFSMVVQYSDRTGVRFYGAEYLYPFYGWIPRAVWPDKPSPGRGAWIVQEVYGRVGNTAAFASTVPGNLYLNFGTAGVLGGLLVIGLLGRAAGVVIQSISSVRFLPLVPYIVFTFGQIQSDVGAFVTGAIWMIVFHIAVLHFLVPDSNQTMAKPSLFKIRERHASRSYTRKRSGGIYRHLNGFVYYP